MSKLKIFLFIICKFYTTEINAQMNIEWVKAFGGETLDEGRSITLDNDGNIFTTGFFEEIVDFDPSNGIYNLSSAGAYDIFISKLDVLGNFLWAKKIGSSGYDLSNSITTDSDGNVYVTGRFNGTVDFNPGLDVFNLSTGELSDLFICKFDPEGNFTWAKQLGGSNLLSFESSNCITIDDNNSLYITGYFSGIADFDPGIDVFNLISTGDVETFILNLDQTGNFIWVKQIICLDSFSQIKGLSIAVDNNRNIYVTGYFLGYIDLDPSSDTFSLFQYSPTVFISKLNPSGNFVWGKKYDTIQIGPTSNDEGKSITCDNSGNVYLVGIFYLTNNFGSTSSNDYITSAGNSDIFITKLDTLGNLIWAKAMGGVDEDIAESVAVDGSGNIYTTGYFNGTADFDPSENTFNLTALGYNDAYINKLDAEGNFVMVHQLGGTFYETGKSIFVDQNENVYCTGNFYETVDFDPSVNNTLNLTSAGSSDVFIQKLSPTATEVIEHNNEIIFTLYPNPSSNEVTIGYSLSSLQNVDFGIYDLRGRLVRKIEKGKKQVGKYVLKVDISNLANGIYIVQMRNSEGGIFKKLLRE
jgi:Secretion system C-terminal sorting domain/Beta-propeller repeat